MMIQFTETRVFVYGTLKPGEINYQKYCQGKVVEEQPAIAIGQLFNLQLRGYPAMTPGSSQIKGFLLTFPDSDILNVLDILEDYDPNRTSDENEYYRGSITVYDLAQQSLGLAWVYLMHPQQVQRLGGILIPSGCWISE